MSAKSDFKFVPHEIFVTGDYFKKEETWNIKKHRCMAKMKCVNWNHNQIFLKVVKIGGYAPSGKKLFGGTVPVSYITLINSFFLA